MDFKRNDIHERTWRAPNGEYVNQTDRVLVKIRGEQNITKLRTYRESDDDIDHFMVDLRITQKFLGKVKNNEKERTKIESVVSRRHTKS